MSEAVKGGRYEIHIDGSSRGNPGPAGCGVVIQDEEGVVLLEEGYPLGEMTNNAAEYTALILALEEAHLLKASGVKVYADSELLVKQMNGEYRVKHPEMKVLYARARKLSGGLKEFSIQHVMREENQAADRLAQQASRDSRKAVKGGNTGSGKGAGPQKSLF